MLRSPPLLATLAALMGAAGVALAAASAHGEGNELGKTAALFLMLQGASLIGVSALGAGAPALAPRLTLAGLALGAATILFSADLAARAFWQARLFPFAAPIGGTAMIVAWLAIALICAHAAWRAPPR